VKAGLKRFVTVDGFFVGSYGYSSTSGSGSRSISTSSITRGIAILCGGTFSSLIGSCDGTGARFGNGFLATAFGSLMPGDLLVGKALAGGFVDEAFVGEELPFVRGSRLAGGRVPDP